MAPRKVVVIGAGPVGALAAIYAANRGDEVEVYELRSGKSSHPVLHSTSHVWDHQTYEKPAQPR